MKLKDFLMTLEWLSFSSYPPQNTDIILRCSDEASGEVKFLRIARFNAVTFNPKYVKNKLGADVDWKMKWHPDVLKDLNN